MNPSQMMPSNPRVQLPKKKRRTSEQVVKDIAVRRAKKMKSNPITKRDLLVQRDKIQILLCEQRITEAEDNIVIWEDILEARISKKKQLCHRLKIDEEKLDLLQKQVAAANQVLDAAVASNTASSSSDNSEASSDNSESS